MRILLSEIGPERFADLLLLKKAGYGLNAGTGAVIGGGNPENAAAERIRRAEDLAAEILSRASRPLSFPPHPARKRPDGQDLTCRLSAKDFLQNPPAAERADDCCSAGNMI